MPAPVQEILAAIDELLLPRSFEDYCVNGLQVPGPSEVRTLASGVSANSELFERTAAEGADLLLVHHGLFWGSGVTAVEPVLKRRLQLLFDADIALAAYHLPLDAHAEIGNNALLAQALGAGEPEPFALHRGQPIGFLASLPGEGLSAADLVARVAGACGQEPLLLGAGPERVQRIAIVSGGGADHLQEAAEAGAQALLTGEAEERSQALARELGVHLIAAGHHATETFGIRALGERVAERFQLRHVFLDVPNPV